jgi:hypothetical protein
MDFYGKEKVQEVENVLHTLLHIEVGQLLSKNLKIYMSWYLQAMKHLHQNCTNTPTWTSIII